MTHAAHTHAQRRQYSSRRQRPRLHRPSEVSRCGHSAHSATADALLAKANGKITRILGVFQGELSGRIDALRRSEFVLTNNSAAVQRCIAALGAEMVDGTSTPHTAQPAQADVRRDIEALSQRTRQLQEGNRKAVEGDLSADALVSAPTPRQQQCEDCASRRA